MAKLKPVEMKELLELLDSEQLKPYPEIATLLRTGGKLTSHEIAQVFIRSVLLTTVITNRERARQDYRDAVAELCRATTAADYDMAKSRKRRLENKLNGISLDVQRCHKKLAEVLYKIERNRRESKRREAEQKLYEATKWIH